MENAALPTTALRALSAEQRIDLLTGLERQRRRFEAAQLRLLAVMAEQDSSQPRRSGQSISQAVNGCRDKATDAGERGFLGRGCPQPVLASAGIAVGPVRLPLRGALGVG